MSFRSVFIALVVSFGLILTGLLINSYRPGVEVDQPNKALVLASGKCAECHRRLQQSVVHEFELSVHAAKGINCLDCHQPAANQEKQEHHGFIIAKSLTAGNCRSCHEQQYQQFARSRHAAPAWAAVYGATDFTVEQVKFAEELHPGSCERPQNALVNLEGGSAAAVGCNKCHAIGKPNSDGTIGDCTSCHTRHTASVAIARLPSTCGQCHMGPDHSQLEIFTESKHGVMFEAQKHLLNLDASPKRLSTHDMFIPTCATCHMSGLNGQKVTHDTTERLSYNLAKAISDKRGGFAQGQAAMKELCMQCHTSKTIEAVYEDAENAVVETNAKIQEMTDLMAELRKEGLIDDKPFNEPIEFMYFDLWHYYGRTVKHGAFMGGQDFAQWHGNYPLLHHAVEIKQMAKELRKSHEKGE